MSFTIGSLFDGSGGFPLAGFLRGGIPVWASEIEPYPIAVTKSRFPYMNHLGSVTDIKGNEIEPVDVITFGSPCQDLSVAGKRAGLKHEDNGDDETTRSGLFMEAVRIIKEMREATNGKYPRFALWENVPGAFSSNKGEDFKVVLEELIKIVEPTAVMPDVPKKGWAYADCYRGDGWSLAYRVLDAQYWGVPQRRRRIYLVADFRGGCAGEILFKRNGLRGYSSQSGSPWETAPGDIESGVGTADYENDGVKNLNCGDVQSKAILDPSGIAPPLYAGECRYGGGECYVLQKCIGFDMYNQQSTGNVSRTVKTPLGGDDLPVVAYSVQDRAGKPGGGKGMLVQENRATSLRTSNYQYIFQPVEQYLFENHSQDSRYKGPLDVCPMLPAQLGTGGNNQPFVVEKTPVYCLQGNGIDRADTAGCNGKGWKEGTSYTLNTINRPTVAYLASGKGSDGTLMANAGTKLWLGNQEAFSGDYHIIEERDYPVQYIVRRLTPTECARLQGFIDDWGHPDKKDDFTDEEYAFWLNVRNTHAEINGKQVKDYTKAQMITWYNKLHTDSSEYKMWGNGIALPNALYVMQGISDVYTSV